MKPRVHYGTVYQYGDSYHFDLDTGARLLSADQILSEFKDRKVKITIEEITEETVENRLMSKVQELCMV